MEEFRIPRPKLKRDEEFCDYGVTYSYPPSLPFLQRNRFGKFCIFCIIIVVYLILVGVVVAVILLIPTQYPGVGKLEEFQEKKKGLPLNLNLYNDDGGGGGEKRQKDDEYRELVPSLPIKNEELDFNPSPIDPIYPIDPRSSLNFNLGESDANNLYLNSDRRQYNSKFLRFK